jgi:tRNA (guanine-N7-)-methyltransferase
MGRRALPRLKSDIDYSHLFREIAELPQPFEWSSLFPESRPLHLEIGSGKGHFLVTESGFRPDDNFLGIEIAKKYARFAAYRCAQQGRTNVRVLAGDAVRFVREAVPAASVDSVHIYFPDPWWKARHRKRRVVRAELVQAVERILKPGGRLHFWTDVEEYFQTGSETILTESRLSGPHPVELPEQPDESFKTHFERRTRLHGLPVYRAEFEKQPTPN